MHDSETLAYTTRRAPQTVSASLPSRQAELDEHVSRRPWAVCLWGCVGVRYLCGADVSLRRAASCVIVRARLIGPSMACLPCGAWKGDHAKGVRHRRKGLGPTSVEGLRPYPGGRVQALYRRTGLGPIQADGFRPYTGGRV